MKCIVTGGLGFIGSSLVDELIENGHIVYVIDNLSTGSLDYQNEKANYEIKDILDRTFLFSFFEQIKPDWVFHLAALPRIQPSFDDPIQHDEVNVRGSINVIDAVKNIGIKALVFSSSSAIYGTPTEFPTSEKAAINPLSPYALQKYAAERYIHILANRLTLPVVSLRYFNPYGPRSFNKKNPFNAYTSVVGIFANQFKNNLPITITGDGLQERDFIHVRDVASANILVAEKIEITNQNVYNVGYGEKISILELGKMFGNNYVFLPEREGEARITHANISELQKLGWNPRYKLNESLILNDI